MRMLSLVSQLQSRVNTVLLTERVCEAMREIALLWFVFALLDKLVADKLTFSWAAWNTGACLALWGFGTYIETRPEESE